MTPPRHDSTPTLRMKKSEIRRALRASKARDTIPAPPPAPMEPAEAS